ncbi:MAG: hypothetical protein OEU54_17570, partial [Gemmatimonadota bacterium]|nr:hypothetical protein [Gemmatimonadota bacterium]
MKKSGLVVTGVLALVGVVAVGMTRAADTSAAIFEMPEITSRVVAAAAPAPNSIVPNPETPLELLLREPVDAASFDPSAIEVFGRWSGVMRGDIAVLDGGRRIRFEPETPFQHGEAVTVSLEAG